ncbi:MAG: ligand-binding sensor domain-containing protein [Chitinophagaceae bacterium]
MHQKFILLFSVFASIYFIASAQNNTLQRFKRCSEKTINYEQGLLNNSTTNIITDALGFTWVSTKTGMQRYNGYVLETINPIINKEIISINSPVYFFALQNGLLWISYKQGVLEYDAKKNSFKKIISLPAPGNVNFSIVPVKETNEGIWCLQNKKGLVIYSSSGNLLKQFANAQNSFIENVFSKDEILPNTTFATNQNSIFIYNGKNQIQQINLQTKQISYINAVNILSFFCSGNKIYIVSNNSIATININDNKINNNFSLKKIMNENLIDGVVFLSENNQLLIGLNNHLFEFDTACNYQKEFTDLNRNPLAAQGFIRIIYTDKFKRIWLLTNDDIKRIQNVDIPFEHFVYTNEKNNFIRSMYYDEKKHVLIAGCYNGGIQLFDSLGNALWKAAITSQNVKDINAIEKLCDNNYLIETIGRGWYVLHLPEKKITPFLMNDSTENVLHSHAINFINNIQRINDSTVFIATKFNILKCVFKNETLKSAQSLLPFNNNASNEISCFIYTLNKTLWAATTAGMIYKIDKNKNVQNISVPNNYLVRSFAEDAQQNIWVGTDRGLYVYNFSGKPIKNFTTQTGLLNDCIYALLPIENKTAVFASSNLGLSHVSLHGNIINYTKESGLQENEFNTESALKTSTGKFYFGGVNGITAFYPSALSNIKDTPVLNITKLIINDSLYNLSSLLQKNSIQLNYSQNHIQLDFAAIGLLNTNEYEYKYRLTGFEENWQTTHQPAGIKYILEPGKYLFEISCSPVLSPNSVFAKNITIIISPPWWQTWWFKILMAVIFVAFIAFIVQQYLYRQYQKKLRALELQHEIQHERERISRDLHDNLGAYAAAIASNVATIKTSENGKDENVLHQLKNNSQSIINQLNDTIWALNKEAISLTAVSDRFKVFLQKIQPNYPNINIMIEENILNDEKLSPTNALHLFRIMQEAVNNALRHSNCKNILVKIISADDWKIIIKDDGKGINNLSEKTFLGNGLSNIKMRSKEAGWKINWIDTKPNGTEFSINN